MQSGKPDPKIVWTMKVPLGPVSAFNAALGKWLSDIATPRTYLFLRSPCPVSGERMSNQGIISKLRGTYGHLGVHFSVISEKPGRMLICASLSKETTKSEPPLLPDGPQGSSKSPSMCGEVVLYPGGIDDLDI
jgi:hypothetical protein